MRRTHNFTHLLTKHCNGAWRLASALWMAGKDGSDWGANTVRPMLRSHVSVRLCVRNSRAAVTSVTKTAKKFFDDR